jgi:quercetin dioxygenase-like cupin family protein
MERVNFPEGRKRKMPKAKRKSAARRQSLATARRPPLPKRKARNLTGSRRRGPPPQRFTVSHYREEEFKSGLRAYAKYRDLGISQATNGMVQAHVIRFAPPFRAEEVSKRHYHDVDFQMIYVLRGWIKTELDGVGEMVMREGSSWIQPPGIEHAVTGYSDDCEVLEIILPADFKTVELE